MQPGAVLDRNRSYLCDVGEFHILPVNEVARDIVPRKSSARDEDRPRQYRLLHVQERQILRRVQSPRVRRMGQHVNRVVLLQGAPGQNEVFLRGHAFLVAAKKKTSCTLSGSPRVGSTYFGSKWAEVSTQCGDTTAAVATISEVLLLMIAATKLNGILVRGSINKPVHSKPSLPSILTREIWNCARNSQQQLRFQRTLELRDSVFTSKNHHRYHRAGK